MKCDAEVCRRGRFRSCLKTATRRFSSMWGTAAVCGTHARTVVTNGYGSWVKFPAYGAQFVMPMHAERWEKAKP